MANINDLIGNFDASTEATSSFDVLPAGEYDAIICGSELKSTKDGKGKYLNLELQVLNGPCQNRKIFDKLNLINNNPMAVQIARGTLSSICRAIGVMTPKDSSELHNKPLRIKVTVKNDEEYGEKNNIKAYKPRLTPAPPAQVLSTPPYTPPTPGGTQGAAPWEQ